MILMNYVHPKHSYAGLINNYSFSVMIITDVTLCCAYLVVILMHLDTMLIGMFLFVYQPVLFFRSA